jgi:O-antigen/teichoic acid export membrane protein
VLVTHSGVRPEFPLQRRIALPLLLNGAPLAVSAFLSLAYQHADKLMTTRFIGTTQTGYLTAAFVIIFGVIELLNTTILIAVYPLMSRYSQAGETFGFIVEKLSFFTLLISVPIGLVLSIFSAEITIPLFGPNFAPTAEVLRILIWYTAAAMTTNIFAQALIVQNIQRRLLVIRASGLVVNITLNALLIPRLQILGAAAASLSAELLVLTVIVWGFRSAGWEWRRTIPRLLRLLIFSAITAVAMLILGSVHPLLGLAAGLLLYVSGLAAGFVLASDDWDLIYRLVAAMPGGRLIIKYWRRDVALNW